MIELISSFGQALEVDSSFIGTEIRPDNLLQYFGLIEQTVNEITHDCGMSGS